MIDQKLLLVICASSSDPSFGGDMTDLLHGTGYFNIETTKHLYDVWTQWPLNIIHASLEHFILALLDVTNGLLYVELFSPVSHMVFPINFLMNYSKGSRISVGSYVWVVRK
jgi:hypothetical protein